MLFGINRPPNRISWQEWELFAGVRSWIGWRSKLTGVCRKGRSLSWRVRNARRQGSPKLLDFWRGENELVGLFVEQREQARRKAFERNCRRPHSFVKESKHVPGRVVRVKLLGKR